MSAEHEEQRIRYKRCWNNRCVKLLVTGKHNENREVHDRNFAKYRCSEAKVLEITDFETDGKYDTASSRHDSSFEYVVGKTIKPHRYEEDTAEVCAPGIHYFCTREAAFYFGLNENAGTFTGVYLDHDDDGRLRHKISVLAGRRHGLFERFDDNGNVEVSTMYEHGRRHGAEILYLPTQPDYIASEAMYKRGILHGWVRYYSFSTGNVEEETLYENGTRKKQCYYYKSGKIYSETHYIHYINHDEWHGPRRVWKSDGTLVAEIMYNYGCKERPTTPEEQTALELASVEFCNE